MAAMQQDTSLATTSSALCYEEARPKSSRKTLARKRSSRIETASLHNQAVLNQKPSTRPLYQRRKKRGPHGVVQARHLALRALVRPGGLGGILPEAPRFLKVKTTKVKMKKHLHTNHSRTRRKNS